MNKKNEIKLNEKITREALYHTAHGRYAYQDIIDDSLVVVLKTKKNDVESVLIRYGDPFNFEFRGKDGGVTQFGGDGKSWWIEDSQAKMKKVFSDDLADYFKVKIFHRTRRVRYAFELKGKNETILYGEHKISSDPKTKVDEIGFTWGYLNKGNVVEIPKWVYETVWYQVFPERFANGDKQNDPESALEWGSEDPTRSNYFGGDLLGVINNLDHIIELGCTGIYFTPIFKANTNHKYDTEDYLEIDPYFGDEATFKELIRKAHQKGIKIMIDAVFNHCGDKFGPWQDVLEKKEASIYYDWFFVSNPQELKQANEYEEGHFRRVEQVYDTFAYVPSMPRLNWANPGLRNYLKQVTEKWTSFGIDAWRLDVANEPPLNFWRKFRHWVKEINPNNYIIGEIWYDSNLYLRGDTFDSVMNYKLRILILDTIKEKFSKDEFEKAFARYNLVYTDTVRRAMFNLLSSHDTPRLLTVFKNDIKKYLFAYKLMFAMQGSPCIYYGDEIGMDGEHDPMCRKCMEWDKSKWNLEIFNTLKKLIQIRKSNPEIYIGESNPIEVDNKNIFGIEYFFKNKSTFSYINFGNKKETLKLKNKVIHNLCNDEIYFDEITIEPQDVLMVKIYDNEKDKKLEKEWWKKAVVYQIYPISFKDSNNDGFGDIRGIIQKLPYLKSLGINSIWLNPIFESPMKDNGYDVSDYFNINPMYGNLKDAEELIYKANCLGIKIILDIVPNHTSTEHNWFKKAEGNDKKFKDYYWITKKPVWEKKSVFGGEAWSKIDKDNYYLHSFAPKQADLNWNNEAVIDEFAKIIDFWIDKGAYGFRFDVIDDIAKVMTKEALLKNEHVDFKKLHMLVKKWRAKSKWLDMDLLTVGEAWVSSVENAVEYTNPKNKELAMIFGFEHVMTNWIGHKWNVSKLDLVKFKTVIEKWQHGLFNKGWNSLFLGNHDMPRAVSNFGSKEHWDKSAKAIALSMHMLQGTPFIYQGEEIGMTNNFFNKLSDHNDVEIHQLYEAMKSGNSRWTEEDHLAYVRKSNRDNARTPMQWNKSVNAGFCDDNATPWIKVNSNKSKINVEKQLVEPYSILQWYKKLTEYRTTHKVSEIIKNGDFKLINKDHPALFMYERNYNGEKLITVVNWSDNEQKVDFQKEYIGRVKMNNYDTFDKCLLKPWQAILFYKKITK